MTPCPVIKIALVRDFNVVLVSRKEKNTLKTLRILVTDRLQYSLYAIAIKECHAKKIPIFLS